MGNGCTEIDSPPDVYINSVVGLLTESQDCDGMKQLSNIANLPHLHAVLIALHSMNPMNYFRQSIIPVIGIDSQLAVNLKREMDRYYHDIFLVQSDVNPLSPVCDANNATLLSN